MNRCTALAAAVFLSGLLTTVSADTLWVHGVVRSSATGTPAIEGAQVTVARSFGMTQLVETGNTDATGEYSIHTSTSSDSAGGVITVTISATGYTTSTWVQTLAIDNQPDTLVHDVTLQPGPALVGDSLYVSGVVTRTGGAPVAGAVVVVTLASDSGLQTLADTTDGSGSYTMAMVNTVVSRGAAINVTATGYDPANADVTTANPANGTADHITRNFTLTAIVYDTLTVTGTVRDTANNSPLQGALGVVLFVAGSGVGGTTVRDTGVTIADGTFRLDMVMRQEQMPANITWTVEMAGYLSKTGRGAVANGAVGVGTVLLAAYAGSDSLMYTITGLVTTQGGAALQGATVVVVMTNATSEVFRDTLTADNRGRYTTTTTRQPYRVGDNTVRVSARASGCLPDTVAVTLPSSTPAITVDLVLVRPATVLVRRMAAPAKAADQVSVYRMDGRRLGTWAAAGFTPAKARGVAASQPLVVRWLRRGVAVGQETLLAP